MNQTKTYHPIKFNELVERIWFLENQGDAIEVITPPDKYINLIFPLKSATWERNNSQITEPQIKGITLQPSLVRYQENTTVVGIRIF